MYREHVMWHGTITRALEAWCRVPQSPREGREWLYEPLRGERVHAWLATVAVERCDRYVASQSALGWGLSLLSFTAAAWRVSPLLVGDCRYVASQFALGWRLSLLSVAAAAWRVSPRLVGDCRY
ncbi:hypothetical protein ACLB2K_032333 [Fragaria x ananassa]